MTTIEEYTIYCTEEQTKKAFELGASVGILDCTVWLDDRLCACGEGVSYKIPRMTDYLYEDGERVESVMLIEDTEEYGDLVCFKPTAEQMIGWLEKQNILIEYTRFMGKYACRLLELRDNGERNLHIQKIGSGRKEATLAAIDAALDYLKSMKEE